MSLKTHITDPSTGLKANVTIDDKGIENALVAATCDLNIYHHKTIFFTDPDGSIDMILTDPPYGTTACKWDSVIPFEPMWKQLSRIIKANGAIVLFGSEPFSSYLRMSNIKNYKYDLYWKKENC